MKNNFQNEHFKEGNYIKAWIKKSENPELYKDFNDLEDESCTNEFIKVVDFNNFNSNFINTIMNEHSPERINKNKKRKAYCLFYNSEIESENNSYNDEHKNYNNIYSSYEDTEIKYFKPLDKTPSCDMKDRQIIYYKDENSSIKKLKRENSCSENNYDIFCNNIVDSSPYLKLKQCTKPSYGSESTSEFFKNYEFETPIKVLRSKEKNYDFKNKKDSSTNTTKENSYQENVSSNNSETKRTINFSNKTEDFNDLQSNSDNEYLTSSEYVDEEDLSRYRRKKQSEVNFLGQKLDYKVVGNVINCSKNHPRFTML
ncbi:conserved Plasmodium protein, unknown function [Plasmodium relictum]|uniref:Uncharacterized protein n=1 Tax=Plasmodium relictum TaxID=85471 RepID=A0A1J1H9P3_PLARL|nr:conserved Plasmodium protein, unknown function [Plasmodium relictum]CRH01661.1 conserved Plasmodium protein, unknown function [Plasmodium relictum]